MRNGIIIKKINNMKFNMKAVAYNLLSHTQTQLNVV